ncbi:QueT transporter family protein [candidate division KSB1 bacterium]|nr:QueT transporter family protein [candidate division KSB1 bacterium]
MAFPTRKIALAGLVGALYAAVTVLLAPLSYGPMQVRVAEALAVLPFVFPETVWGLYFGCMAANIFGGYGPIDIFFGSLLTLAAALLTRALARSRRRSAFWLAPLPPVLINALGVAWILHLAADMPYAPTALWVGIGQTISCYGLGLPLLSLLLRRKNTLAGR